jgi:hypothetical protein
MKVRSKTDSTAAGDKKIRLIDGFGFNGSYNFMAPKFKLSTFQLYLRSTLFEKINITSSAQIDPYEKDEFGERTNTYIWQTGRYSIGRLTDANIAISTSFQSKDKKGDEKKKQQSELDENMTPMTMEEQQSQLDYIRNNPSEFADFNIPWSVNLSYSLSLNRVRLPNYSAYKSNINSNLSVNGDFNLTPKWKTGMSAYYDFNTMQISSLTMFLSREMHCWQMSINVTPVGLYRFFNINISPKSSLLRDIKVNRTRSFYGG